MIQQIRKLAKVRAHLRFLNMCKSADVVPRGFFTKNPTSHYNKHSNKFDNKLERHFAYTRMQKHICYLHYQLTTLEKIESTNNFNKPLFFQYYKKFLRNKFQKFNKLKRNKQKVSVTNSVVNFSSHVLNDTEKFVLSLGLDYVITPKKVNPFDIITKVEHIINKIPPKDQIALRNDVIHLIKKRNRRNDIISNLNAKQFIALKNLRNDKSIHITRADKGNVTVIMNKSDYLNTINTVLTKEQYDKLPDMKVFNKYANSVDRNIITIAGPKSSPKNIIFKFFADDPFILSRKSLHNYRHLHPQPAWLYNMPKIHKAGFSTKFPVRHITANCDLTPGHKLSKKLSELFQPLVGKTSTAIKDGYDFVKLLNDNKFFEINDSTILVSFDVEGLYPNTPVEEAISLLEERVNNNIQYLSTDLKPEELIKLVHSCLRLSL